MKIGFKAKSYNDVVYFDLGDDGINADYFITALFSNISAESESDLDFVVTVSKKKEVEEFKEDFYQIVADELNITREEAKLAILKLQYKGENKTN